MTDKPFDKNIKQDQLKNPQKPIQNTPRTQTPEKGKMPEQNRGNLNKDKGWGQNK